MPRPQRDLDPHGGPLVEFARDLRALRTRAGTPKFATMARRTGRSKTALADASAGQHLPRWETVEDFVRACEGDPAAFYDRWFALRSRTGEPAVADPAVADPTAPAPDPAEPSRTPGPGSPASGSVTEAAPAEVPPTRSDHPASGAPADAPSSDRPAAPPPVPAPTRSRGRRPALVAAAVGGVLVVGVLGFVLGRLTVPAAPVLPQTVEAIEVQNKVALGPDRLVEDTTPAYLSTQALAYCASPDRSCKVPGTEMASGAAVVANCWTQGQMMWNWDLADPTAQSNPNRARSDSWYRASFPDGRTGYLAEVYVVRGDRGGRGLPRCTP